MRVENFLLDSTEMNQLQSHLISRQEVPSDTFKKLFSDERSLLNFRAQELKVRKIFVVFMFNFQEIAKFISGKKKVSIKLTGNKPEIAKRIYNVLTNNQEVQTNSNIPKQKSNVYSTSKYHEMNSEEIGYMKYFGKIFFLFSKKNI